MEREARFKQDRILTNIISESSGEYVLPDYKGDVRKILLTKAKAVPTGKYPGQGRVEYVGNVIYSVVYLDGENRLCGVEFSTDYQLDVKCDEENYVDSICHTRVANFNIRLMGPRKFNAKANLESSVNMSETRTLSVEGDAATRDDAELYSETVSVGASLIGETKGREYKESVCDIDGAIEEEVEILLINTEPRVNSVTVRDGEADVLGEVLLTVLISRNEEMPYTVSAKIPISERVSVEGIREGMEATGYMYVTETAPSFTESEEGVTLFAEISVDVEVFASVSEDVVVYRDMYLCDSETENKYGVFTYPTPYEQFSLAENVSLETPVSECGIEKIRNVVYGIASVIPEEINVSEKAVNIKGKIRVSGIACEINEAGGLEYAPIKFDSYVDINANNSCQIKNGNVKNSDIRVRDFCITNDADKIYTSFALELRGSCCGSKDITALISSFISGSYDKRDKSEVVVYYPESDDTLFGIAKKYHTTAMDIASANSLTESVFNSMGQTGALSGIKKLIIR